MEKLVKLLTSDMQEFSFSIKHHKILKFDNHIQYLNFASTMNRYLIDRIVKQFLKPLINKCIKLQVPC